MQSAFWIWWLLKVYYFHTCAMDFSYFLYTSSWDDDPKGFKPDTAIIPSSVHIEHPRNKKRWLNPQEDFTHVLDKLQWSEILKVELESCLFSWITLTFWTPGLAPVVVISHRPLDQGLQPWRGRPLRDSWRRPGRSFGSSCCRPLTLRMGAHGALVEDDRAKATVYLIGGDHILFGIAKINHPPNHHFYEWYKPSIWWVVYDIAIPTLW